MLHYIRDNHGPGPLRVAHLQYALHNQELESLGHLRNVEPQCHIFAVWGRYIIHHWNLNIDCNDGELYARYELVIVCSIRMG